MEGEDRPSRSRLLPWAIIVALAGILLLILTQEEGQETQPPALEGPSDAETGLAPALAAPPEREEPARDDLPLPGLKVIVVSSLGGVLQDARIHAAGPRGFFEDAKGSAEWENLYPGEWTLSAEVVGHFSEKETVFLSRGEQKEARLVLRPAGLITGKVSTTLGRPWPGAQVWFLRPGQIHPPLPGQETGVAMATCNKFGEFTSPPLAAGEYTLSVGPIGVQRALDSSAVTLAEAETREVEVTIDRGMLVRVYLPGLENAAHQRPKMTLVRPDRRGESARRPGREERWDDLTNERPRPNQNWADFYNISRGEYWIQVETRDRGRFRTDASFQVDPEHSVALEIALPAEGDRRSREYLPVPLKLLPDAEGMPGTAESGFRWIR